jgi:hypothetical protein
MTPSQSRQRRRGMHTLASLQGHRQEYIADREPSLKLEPENAVESRGLGNRERREQSIDGVVVVVVVVSWAHSC